MALTTYEINEINDTKLANLRNRIKKMKERSEARTLENAAVVNQESNNTEPRTGYDDISHTLGKQHTVGFLNNQHIAAQEHIMIGDTRIEMVDGLYSLNDLHKASGAKASKSPSKWQANKGTKAFLSATRIRVLVQNGGSDRSSTYAPKKAVYAYAMWISPLFQSNVIDVFDAYVTGTLQTQVPQEQPQEQPLIPKTFSEALQLACNQAQEIEQQAAQLAIAAPKVEYCDTVLNSDGGLRTTEIAAELGISATALNAILRNQLVQRKVGGRWVLTVSYCGYGYGLESTFIDVKGRSHHSLKWTEKGRQMIHELMSL
ncbi:MAG TPA: hypothetical protein EYN67_13775 [Flavobacteriales bacterium]|nr:hypothetical protein [Flavobacteriales bacterium]